MAAATDERVNVDVDLSAEVKCMCGRPAVAFASAVPCGDDWLICARHLEHVRESLALRDAEPDRVKVRCMKCKTPVTDFLTTPI